MVKAYAPHRGDIVVIDFNPQAGREQAGRRPALVLSPSSYNHKTGLAILCPITNQAKGYIYEVHVPRDSDTTGVILADQVKSMDWRSRKAKTIDRMPREVVLDVLAKVATLLDSEDD